MRRTMGAVLPRAERRPIETVVRRIVAHRALSTSLRRAHRPLGSTRLFMRIRVYPTQRVAHAYVFRASVQNGQVRVEYHPMACKLDPGAEVPQELYRAPGALVPRVR
jgi:hypothetical protein